MFLNDRYTYRLKEIWLLHLCLHFTGFLTCVCSWRTPPGALFAFSINNLHWVLLFFSNFVIGPNRVFKSQNLHLFRLARLQMYMKRIKCGADYKLPTPIFPSTFPSKEPSQQRVKKWGFSLEDALKDPAGQELFLKFLESEFSSENLRWAKFSHYSHYVDYESAE